MLRLIDTWRGWREFAVALEAVAPGCDAATWESGTEVKCRRCHARCSVADLPVAWLQLEKGKGAQPFVFCRRKGCPGTLLDIKRVVAA